MKKLFFDRKTVIQFVGLRQKGFGHLENVNQREDGERESRRLDGERKGGMGKRGGQRNEERVYTVHHVYTTRQ